MAIAYINNKTLLLFLLRTQNCFAENLRLYIRSIVSEKGKGWIAVNIKKGREWIAVNIEKGSGGMLLISRRGRGGSLLISRRGGADCC